MGMWHLIKGFTKIKKLFYYDLNSKQSYELYKAFVTLQSVSLENQISLGIGCYVGLSVTL